jgi:hypothetical protein
MLGIRMRNPPHTPLPILQPPEVEFLDLKFYRRGCIANSMKICLQWVLLMYLALWSAQDSFCHDGTLGLLEDVVKHSHHVHPATVHENQRFTT